MLRVPSLFAFVSILSLVAPNAVFAQEDEDADPLKGTTKLGDSSEILLLWADPENEGTRVQTIYDYLNFNNPDPEVPNELSAQETQTISSDAPLENDNALDAITGDFDGDGLDDYVAVWEGPDRSIEMIIPDLDRTNLQWTASNHVTVAEAGSLVEHSDFNRLLRLAAADFDDDRGSEFLLAYWRADAALQIELYDATPALAPRLLSTFRDPEVIRHAMPDVPRAVARSSRWFDVNAGDFDGDGTDEVIVATALELECAFNSGCWSVFVRVYDVHPESYHLVPRAETTIYSKENNLSEYMNRIAVEPGRFAPEFAESAAIVFQQTTNNQDTRWYLNMTRVLLAEAEDGSPLPSDMWGSAADTSRFESGPDGTDQIHGTMGGSGYALSADAADFHQDGFDELVLYYRQLEIYEMGEDLAPTLISSLSSSSETGDDARHALAVADLDADNDLANSSSEWRPEIVVVSNGDISDDGGTSVDGILRLSVYAYSDEIGFNGLQLASTSDHRIDPSGARPVTLAALDVGDNGVRVGPPTHSARTDIVRPLVILNAPPTHYDVIGGATYDVTECYGEHDCACQAARARCFQAEYSTTSERTITTETELTSDWSIATTATGGGTIPLIKVGVDASITATYGEGFRRTDRGTESFTVTQAIQATRDDWIYAMIVNYDIWEYPLYSDGEHVGHIAVVVPRLNTRAWFDSKSWNAFDHIPYHEVGNILSYRSIAQPEDNSSLAEAIRWDTGDQITLSGTSDVLWQLTSEMETETEVENSVNMGINGEVSFNIPVSFIPNVSVAGDYSTETVNTQTTKIRDQQGLAVALGNVDESLGNTRYDVIPYVYWAKNGALVLDYAVNPELAQPGFEPTWWQSQYGELPDPAFILPWRYDREKGGDITEAQSQQTREILFDPIDPEVGDVVTIKARVHNWSLLPTIGPIEVRFFVGDPAAGGVPIEGVDGETSVTAAQMTDRGSAIVEMDWEIPAGIGVFPRIYAVIDPLDDAEEIHESNNKGWTVLNIASPTHSDGTDELPTAAKLFQNYPNPFTESTTIAFTVVGSGHVRLEILDVLGRKVGTIVDQKMTAGAYNAHFDAGDLASGMYAYRLTVDERIQTKSMVLVR